MSSTKKEPFMSEKISFKTFLRHIRNFPVTLVTIWLFTFILIISVETPDREISESLNRILLFIFYYGSGSFLIEALFLHKKQPYWYYYLSALLLNLLLPAFFTYLFIRQTDDSYYWDYFMRYTVSWFAILFFTAVYFCHRKLNCSLPDYLVRVWNRTVRYHIFYFILMVGLSLIASIISELFNLDFNLILESHMLLFGLYYMSSFLLSFYPENPEDNVLTGTLVRYILPVIIICAYVIIYVYILKILIFRDIPSNSVFRITAGLFLTGIPVCIMNSFYQEKNPFSQIIRRLPYLFLPFIPLQGYSIGIRIFENGLTPVRCCGVVFLLFECITLTLYCRKRDAIPLLFLILPALFFIGGFLPYVNVHYLSYLSQRQEIERYLSLPEAEQEMMINAEEEYRKPRQRITGAYRYLKKDQYGRQYLEELPEDARNSLALLGSDSYSSSEIAYRAEVEDAPMNVSDFDYCIPFYALELHRADEAESDDVAYDLEKYLLLPDDRPEFTADLSALFYYYMEHADTQNDIQSYFSENHTYTIDSAHTIVLTEIAYDYDTQDETFTYFQIKGYILEK